MNGLLDEVMEATGISVHGLENATIRRQIKTEDKFMNMEQDEEDKPLPEEGMPVEDAIPVTIAAKKATLESFSVDELIKALSIAIQREKSEQVVRVVPDQGPPFRLTSAFISTSDTTVTLWLRRGLYEPFQVDTEEQSQLVIEFGAHRLRVMYVGGSATLPGFDYDMVSFLITRVEVKVAATHGPV